MDLDKLISGCIKKNPEARERLYYLYRDKLFSVCLKYCCSFEEAEDHLHDTFITIFEKIKTYKGKGSFEGWMKRIAIYKAIDKYKKRTDFELATHKLSSLHDEVYMENESQSIPIEVLMGLIQKLPNQYRLIFNLYELDGFPHKEISQIVGISESTSKSNLFRSKLLLKQRILEYISLQTLKKTDSGN
ncbi:MAG: RNA polymerase sigma factor [Bacteroidota bacterium]